MPETLADIVAEMRELAADIEAGNAVVGQTVWRNYADRIEAAARRLREDVIAETVKAAAKSAAEVYEPHIHDDNPSNAAAMREALEYIGHYCDSDDNMDDPYCADGHILAEKAQAALSVPPRNCDIYTTEDAVDTATVTVRDECDGCPSLDMEAPCVFCMVRWLLAPAKKGGEK